MAGVIHVRWYATVFRGDDFAAAVAAEAPLVMRYGATKYAVHRSNDDRYSITQMIWFEEKRDWYRFWEGPEMVAFRRRFMNRYQIPITYIWHEELAAGEVGPDVALEPEQPEPVPEPQATA